AGPVGGGLDGAGGAARRNAKARVAQYVVVGGYLRAAKRIETRRCAFVRTVPFAEQHVAPMPAAQAHGGIAARQCSGTRGGIQRRFDLIPGPRTAAQAFTASYAEFGRIAL